MKRSIASVGLIGTGLITFSLAFAAPASAHVTVNSTNAKQGGFAVLNFRAPTESASASTTALHVQFPTDTPFAFVSVQPHAGWSYKVKHTKLATPITVSGESVSEVVSEIDWTATTSATSIKPGEFDQFNISVGPLPTTASITFKAIQHYSDGTEVDWINTPAPGSTAKVEHPAPTLALAPTEGAATPAPDATGTEAAGAQPEAASKASARAGIALGGAGVLLGAVGLGLSVHRRPGK